MSEDLGLYTYTGNFSTNGIHYYNITCSKAGHTTLFLRDYVSIENYRTPNGAEIEVINSTNAQPDQPQVHYSIAGNVTELTIKGYSTTQSWQGYVGEVRGAIELSDANENVLYNWTQLNPNGEIYSTRVTDTNFATIRCADSGEIANEEGILNQSSTDADSVSNTFSQNNHPKFYVGSREITQNECKSVNLYDEEGTGTKYSEVLLADNSSNIVYTSIIEKNQAGYNSKTYDFEMIVGENGHNADIEVTPYYFYLEIS